MKRILSAILLPLLLSGHAALAADEPSAGLKAEYYDFGSTEVEDYPVIATNRVPTIKRIDKDVNFRSTELTFPGTKLQSHFAVKWTGKIKIPKTAQYTFYLESDDGARLFIDGKQVVDNGGLHAMQEAEGDVDLKEGDHEIKIDYYENENDGGAGCVLSWESKGLKKEVVPAKALSH